MKENNAKDMELIQGLCDLVITMIYDNRLPVEVREEYRKIIEDKYKFVPLLSYDLMVKLANKK